jgi:hypothetical protein
MEPTVHMPLDRHKKTVEVHMKYYAIHRALSHILVQRAAQRVHFALQVLEAS